MKSQLRDLQMQSCLFSEILLIFYCFLGQCPVYEPLVV